MGHKTVLKVNISCDQCKRKLLKAVSGLQGVDKVEIDGTKKTLTVTGDADPFEIIQRTKKTGLFSEVVTVGPPQKPNEPKKADEKKDDKKKDEKKQHQPHIQMLHPNYDFYPYPERPQIVYMTRPDPNPECCIM
ncbi:hypothetical protein Leryth_007012 [Lithospermum erythrorhizon]|uniref:HMA domain-containing protein n=1 Tax=Lithospermum erythrorhizon TaxID=34254 RepID=A0AAV3RSX9_LITER|nr:hypothetical protein Leryth_007012 [Lithospermum erythrorhizon]